MSKATAEINKIMKDAIEKRRGEIKTQQHLENKHQIWRRWSKKYRQRAGESIAAYEARLKRKARLYRLRSQLKRRKDETAAEYEDRLAKIKNEIEALEEEDEEDAKWDAPAAAPRDSKKHYVRGNSRPMQDPSGYAVVNAQQRPTGVYMQKTISEGEPPLKQEIPKQLPFASARPLSKQPQITIETPANKKDPLPVSSSPEEIPYPPITTKPLPVTDAKPQPPIEEKDEDFLDPDEDAHDEEEDYYGRFTLEELEDAGEDIDNYEYNEEGDYYTERT